MNILNILEDNSGGISSMRAVFLIWFLGVFLVWGYISVINKELKPVPESIITLLGVAATAKTIQRFGEKPSDEETK